jgi:nucleoside triphosphate diphosphatase
MSENNKIKSQYRDIHNRDIGSLLAIMSALRTPETGCPWDLVQDFGTIVPYTIEEAYEVADAIERRDFGDLCDELGDLLLQVVYHAQMAEEIGEFTFSEVVAGICTKMIRRHPHVFGDESERNLGQVKGMWEAIKLEEKQAKNNNHQGSENQTALSGVPTTLPPLTRAIKLQEKAARVGFDWKDPEPVFDKVIEELEEVRAEMIGATDAAALEQEVGDLLFAVTNLARHLDINPEVALGSTNRKFESRFGKMEQVIVNSGKKLEDTSLAHMEEIWQQAKQET